MYANFIYHIYIHDKSMAKILTEQAIKRRHQRTVISFSCQMYCYIFECICISIMIWCQHLKYGLNFFVFLFQFEFAIRSIIEAMSTYQTRERLFSIPSQLKLFFHWLIKLPSNMLVLMLNCCSSKREEDHSSSNTMALEEAREA